MPVIYSATLIQRPRKPHYCENSECRAYLHGRHLRLFGKPDCSDQPFAWRICTDCGARYYRDEPKVWDLIKEPPKRRTPGANRTLGERFADTVRSVKMWQDGIDEAEIAEELGLSLADVGDDTHHFCPCGDMVLEMARDMMHATAWPKCYRNHYVASRGGPDEARWARLEAWGLATRGRDVPWIEGVVFAVSDAGREALDGFGDYLR